mmetsp:Transcript_30037/g.49865  ORF Transcript_30037/g.49865 Transcript_30037/m.49865 type:complete len:171 (-) Transcript_30037:1010-1522(-)
MSTCCNCISKISLAVAMLLLLSCIVPSEAYTTSHDLRQLSRNSDKRRKIWMPPSNPGSQPHDLVSQKMLKTSGTEHDRRRTGWKPAQAALNDMDATFAPRRASSSSPLAHGLLSPETVARMDEITAGGHGNEAVRVFLQTYRRKGPMSCLEMLSDPEILPHLTSAMRDIV